MLTYLGATIPEWIVFIWATLSFPFYILTVYIIIKYRKEDPFNSPFFTLFISEAVADIGVLLDMYFTLSFRVWGWLDYKPLFLHENPTLRHIFRMFYYPLTWFFLVPQVVGVAVISFNRFDSIVRIKTWSSRTVAFWVGFQWFAGVVAAIPWMTQSPYTVETVNGTDGQIIWHSRPPPTFHQIMLLLLGPVFMSTVSTIVSITYAVILFSLRKHNKTAAVRTAGQPTQTTQSKKAEIRLAFMGFVLFLMLLLYMVFLFAYMVTIKMENNTMKHLTNIILYQIGSVMSGINPYLLLICSSKTRIKFKFFFARLMGKTDNGPEVVQLQAIQSRTASRQNASPMIRADKVK